MQAEVFLPSNSFSSLIINGLIKINGVHTTLTLSKGISKPAKTLIVPDRELDVVGALPPVRPPSKLPPPGDLCLHVSLEPNRLGYGRVGSVYPLIMDGIDQHALPPLVIKVAVRRRSQNLAREAWFYEEMEDIQGVAIARCYGLFSAEIDPNSEVLDWAESDEDDDEEVDNLDEDSQSQSDDDSNDEWTPNPITEFSPTYPVMTLVTWETPLELEEKAKLRRPRKDKRDPIIRSTHVPEPNGSEKTFLSVLVLERLGDLIPIGAPLESVTPDIHEIFSDMGQFGVEHMDIRWRNILAAPATPHSIVCPYHGHKHQWRVVDFDLSRKSNYPLPQIESAAGSWLGVILEGLAEGYVVDNWD